MVGVTGSIPVVPTIIFLLNVRPSAWLPHGLDRLEKMAGLATLFRGRGDRWRLGATDDKAPGLQAGRGDFTACGANAVVADADDRLVEVRMARRNGIALVERPADGRLPRRVDVCAADNGELSKLDPLKKYFARQYQHHATPADFDLDPLKRFDAAKLALLPEPTQAR